MARFICDAAEPHENILRIDLEKKPFEGGKIVWANKDACKEEGKIVHRFVINGVPIALEYNLQGSLAVEIRDAPAQKEFELIRYLERVIGAVLVPG